MKLTVLTVPDCPNGPVLDQRLAEVLADRPDVRVTRRVITDERVAAEAGMHGSPTLLVDGADPFADQDTPASISCRIYRDTDGSIAGAPSTAALRQALGFTETPTEPWEDPLGRAGAGRLAPENGGQRAVQQYVLRAFATTGRPPTTAELATAAAPYEPGAVLATLHTADFLRLDATGRIAAAYPFSATPTPHTVRINGRATAYAMCAIDALGIASMLGTDAWITSADPLTGEPITITVPAPEPDAPAGARWDPPTAVVFAGRATDSDCHDSDCPAPAADTCCGHVNFFTTPDTANAWAAQHPEITGRVLPPDQAEHLGSAIFGPLLKSADSPSR